MRHLREFRKSWIEQLKESGISSAAFDFDMVLEDLFSIGKEAWLSDPDYQIAPEQQDALTKLLTQYKEGKPLQYLLGHTSFMGLPFQVRPGVLIPRNDTEILCEYALSCLPVQAYVLDMCTGSGCIGISLQKLRPDIQIFLSDISPEAVRLCRENARALIPDKQYHILQGDLFSPVKRQFPKTRFDMILSNPPYIPSPTVKTLEKQVREYEPILALDGGTDGLKLYRRLIKEAPSFLKQDGRLLLEIGYDQAEAVSDLLKTSPFTQVEIMKDYGGNYRVAAARLSSSSRTV